MVAVEAARFILFNSFSHGILTRVLFVCIYFMNQFLLHFHTCAKDAWRSVLPLIERHLHNEWTCRRRVSCACQMNIPVALTKRERSPLIVPGVDDSKCSTTHSHSYGCACVYTYTKEAAVRWTFVDKCLQIKREGVLESNFCFLQHLLGSQF